MDITKTTNTWKAGRLLNPLPDDPEFADWQDACDFARKEAEKCNEVPFGIWLMPSGLLDAIAYGDQLFTE